MNTVKPIILTDTDTGMKYTLEFSRESVKFAEDRGFDTSDLAKFPMTKISEFFFYAFRMHHRNMSKQQTDAILYEQLGGLPDGMLDRLSELYAVPFDVYEPGETKNSKMTVEM